ncbi:MAG: Septum formation initiator [Parcubacteria group bacterium GW2011_GWE2_39_37]|uniref:Septum formation initiator n=1 Tax=Candidatus Falkowbacteria bacterium GW2011_GWF2_39_8 TaxID=1618642 RepID=A0A0G0PSP7_9BACT|nr:MAG: Septum formation initiator [Parcubacteria group bacterium GW2011_GWE2_39_37]KKR30943.1 MAG: Septum formation initiator [Candidatus Falkowbacteria bacterium GW2011_GWF2_39_8]
MITKNKNNFFLSFLFKQSVLTIIGVVLLIAISIPLAKNLSRRYRINNEISQLDKEIQEIEKKNTDLQKLIKYLESDQFAEEQARLNLGLKKEGESVAIVKNDLSVKKGELIQSEKQIFNIPGLEKSKPKPISNPQQWLNYFFK